MIRVTDRTLSCLDGYDASARQLTAMCRLLLELGADTIELSADAFQKMGTLPKGCRYILRVGEVSEISRFPGFNLYTCRQSGFLPRPDIVGEVQVNDVSEIASLHRYRTLPGVRITGLDDLFCHDCRMAFDQIRKNLTGKVELCPEDGYSCATAIAAEWILSGGKDVVSSWNGIGGFAPTEEIFLALRLLTRYKPTQDYSKIPRMRQLFEEITGVQTPRHRPVSGADIFDIEAGIHVDGVSKDPQVYEPYKPELVGVGRRLVVGKHSGRASILLKMKELGVSVRPDRVRELLRSVRRESVARQRSLTDDEFRELVRLSAWEKGDCDENTKGVG
ncbi:MAG: isopropylmalate synthase [Oscillospiraceae bacterium]|nr:isopropylmalate synthase [Oscillospiraceae bacterium]MCI2035750.1 isopropylmalate synthase [Oscillospiraceae bacterium]